MPWLAGVVNSRCRKVVEKRNFVSKASTVTASQLQYLVQDNSALHRSKHY
jgi:hypothetical protein